MGLLTSDPLLKAALIVFLVLSISAAGAFTYYYVKYGRMIDQRFKGPVFGDSARIYAIPHAVQVGEKIEAKEIARELRRAGYPIRAANRRWAATACSTAESRSSPARILTTARNLPSSGFAAAKWTASPASPATLRPMNSNRR